MSEEGPVYKPVCDPSRGTALIIGFLGLLAVFVSIFWFACSYERSKKRDEELRNAALEVKLDELRKERTAKKLAVSTSKASKPPFGFVKITKEIPLSTGMSIYEERLGMQPKYVGHIESIEERGVFVVQRISESGQIVGETKPSPIPEFIGFSSLYERHLAR